MSGDNGGPINIDPKSPKWKQLIIGGAALITILSVIACGEMGAEDEGNFVEGNKVSGTF